jgi:hypothetical protein
MIPALAIARVTAHDPPRRVQVVFGSTGQQPSFTVQMGLDYGNALSVRQKPLPGIGSWGLVAFPRGDYRNGIWLCTYMPNLMDAMTYAGQATDPFIDMEAHFSGYWRQLDGKGQEAKQWPDGSFFNAASGGGSILTLPTVYRHIVDNNQQKRVPYTRQDRIPNPPSPFGFAFVHQTGTLATIGPSGNALVSGAAGKTITLVANGATIQIDAAGNIAMTTPGTFTLHAGGAVVITGSTINLN